MRCRGLLGCRLPPVSVGGSPLYMLGLCGPLIAAVVTTAIQNGRTGLRDLVARMVRVRVGAMWWLAALGLPLAVAAATYVVLIGYSVFLLAPIEVPSWRSLGQFNGFPVSNALGMWAMLVIVNGYGEETGWRGFLLPQLQRGHSPLVAGLLVGGFWAVWHVPALFVTESYRLMPLAMIPMLFLGVICGSLLLTWLYNRGRQSIALVAVWHGTYNLFSGTVGARGTFAAVESTAVMIVAAVLLIQELRAIRSDHGGQPGRHVMAAG
jgi:uncharacterized protein